jgi:Protein of unknown function (DUF2934)
MSSATRLTKDDRVIKHDPLIEEDPLVEEDIEIDEDPEGGLVPEGDPESEDYPMHAEALPFEERVRQRAHRLYLNRGDRPGSAEEDWLQAEEEVRLEDRRQDAAL